MVKKMVRSMKTKSIRKKLTEGEIKKMAKKVAFEDPKVVKAEVDEIAEERLNKNRQNKWQALKQYFEAFILLKHMSFKKADYVYLIEQMKSDMGDDVEPETIFSETLTDENGLPVSLARLQHIDFEQHVAIRLHSTLVKELAEALKQDFDLTDEDISEAWKKLFIEKVSA